MPDLLERLTAALSDRYAIESEIGRGGMATVYLAEDLKHHRKVAIKVLHPELAAAVGPERFLREIEIASHLEHPNILALYDSGEADGLPYYVMPYVEGESLRARLEHDGSMPIAEALSIVAEVANALVYAHGHGVIHRDIKPGNILLSSGHARVADFGVARAIGEAGEGESTATGLVVGTPKYMSPEQASGDDLDGRADVYALGCVLYEMLIGSPPFDGPTPASILAQKLTGGAAIPVESGYSIPADVQAVLARATAPEPSDRYPSAVQFQEAVTAPDILVPTRTRGVPTLAGSIAVAVGLVVAVFALWRVLPVGHDSAALDPDLIAVIPFRSVGTGEALAELGRGMPDLFWIKVNGDYGPRTADPATVASLWEAAGGTSEVSISEQRAVDIAGRLGAGRVVVGVISGNQDRIALTARLLEAPSGRVRVNQTTVEGAATSGLDLVDALINRILARDFGESIHRLPAVAAYHPAAVQAYLKGIDAFRNHYALNSPYFDEAIERDSTFLLAALAKYQYGESDAAAARYAWTRQNELSVRDRTLLRALAGWRFGATRTVRERIAQYDSVGLDDWDPANDVVWNLHVFGRLSDMPNWRERDLAARQRIDEFRPSLINRFRLFELAAAAADTAAMRRYAREMRGQGNSAGAKAASLAADLRLAAAVRDTAVGALWSEAADLLVDTFPPMATALLSPLLDGANLAGLDRLVEALPETGRRRHFGMVWSRARGRYEPWRSFREKSWETRDSVAVAWRLIRDVLFLGEPEDSRVLAAADLLYQHSIGPPPQPAAESGWTIEDQDFARALCWSTLWRVDRGQVAGAADAVRYLREVAPLPYRWSVCAALIEVFLSEAEGGNTRAAVRRLDFIVSSVPMEDPTSGARDGTHFVDNLFLSQRLPLVGDTSAALNAARRARPWEENLVWSSAGLFVDLLREEARLAPMVGDTAGATDAYELYFKLRDVRPDHPPWAAQWDSMRAEYASLTGVEGLE